MQNLNLESKHNFLYDMSKPKNTIWVTNAVKLILDLPSKCCRIHFKRYVYFVEHEWSQMPQSGTRQELGGKTGICRSDFPVIILSQDLTAIVSAPWRLNSKNIFQYWFFTCCHDNSSEDFSACMWRCEIFCQITEFIYNQACNSIS